MIGGGATLGLGKLSVDDPRALDGSVDIRYFDYGPEAQLGVRFVNGGIVDTRMFASFAYLRTELDERLMIDAVGGVQRGNAVLSAGATAYDRRRESGSHRPSPSLRIRL
jgi:hypothetical protein